MKTMTAPRRTCRLSRLPSRDLLETTFEGIEERTFIVGDKGVSEKICSLSDTDKPFGRDPITASVKKFEAILESV
jgi:hypothetical protein